MAGMFFLYPFEPGDIVTLKKPHPCGGREWNILRVGSDITLVCAKCGHMMILPRRTLEKACVQVDTSARQK